MAVFKKTMRKHIFLHPMDKKRQQMAVKSALLQNKKKYCDKLEGALLDVNNLKVVGDRHLIVDGYLSMEVIADFQVFSPKLGQTLEGVINKRSRSHLGCLVLDTFNAALDTPSFSEFDPHVGDNCTFVVTEVLIDGDILFLRGKLTGVTPNQMAVVSDQETKDMLQTTNVAADNDEPDTDYKKPVGELEDVQTSDDHSHKRKKTHKSPSKTKKKKID